MPNENMEYDSVDPQQMIEQALQADPMLLTKDDMRPIAQGLNKALEDWTAKGRKGAASKKSKTKEDPEAFANDLLKGE